MSRAIVTVTIVVDGDPGDLVDAINDFDGAVFDHFTMKHYCVQLLSTKTSTRNDPNALPLSEPEQKS